MDESKTSNIRHKKEGEEGQTQKSGFGSYIASFFLTESELDN